MTFVTGQQAKKCKTNHEVPPAESSKVAPEPRREVAADRHCLDFNLALITFSHFEILNEVINQHAYQMHSLR